MAIQTGIIQFTGKLGHLLSRKVNGKHIIQKPGRFTTAADTRK